MKDRSCFSIVLRGQLPAQSHPWTKKEVVSAEDSPSSTGCAFDVSTPHLVPEHEGFCPLWGQSPSPTNPLWELIVLFQ